MDPQVEHFVGYATLEAFLVTRERASALYMTQVEEGHLTSDPGVVSRRTYVVVSDVQDGVARFWRYRIGGWLEVGDQPLDPAQAAQLRARAERVKLLLTRAIREEFGLMAQAAMVSFPKTLTLLDGVTGLLRSEDITELLTKRA